MDVVIIGNPENRRTTMFCEAAKGPVTVLPYLDLLSGKSLPAIKPGSIVKIDSPGENVLVRKLLIEKGQVSAVVDEERGIIRHMDAWYKGYCRLLDEIDQHQFRLMNTTADIRLMFDKPACQRHLQQQGIPVPHILPAVHDYASLVTMMQQQKIMRVFVKPAHASSASGVIAFRRYGRHVQAITSAEIDRTSGEFKLYNSLRVRTYSKEEDITALIDTILTGRAQVEEWLPKAALEERYFDVRVLVIAGVARHTVIRTSKQIITNLHLGNKRGDMQVFLHTFGEEKMMEIRQLAERTAACFPDSLYMGVDIMLAANRKNLYVLEVNAFGDLLPGLTDKNENCYEAELSAAKHLI